MKKIIMIISLVLFFTLNITKTFAESKADCYTNKNIKEQIIKEFEKEKILTKDYIKFLRNSSFSVSFTDSTLILHWETTNWVFYNFYNKIYLNKEIQCSKSTVKETFLHETLHLYWKKNAFMKERFSNMLNYAETVVKTIPNCSKVKTWVDCLQEDPQVKWIYLTSYWNPWSSNLKVKYILAKSFIEQYKIQKDLLPNKKYLTEKQEKEYALNEVMAHTWDGWITKISCWEQGKYDVLYLDIFNMKRKVCKK